MTLPSSIKPTAAHVVELRDRLKLSTADATKLATYQVYKDAIRDAETIDDLKRVLWNLVEHTFK